MRFLDHTQTQHSPKDSSGHVIDPSQRPLPTQHAAFTTDRHHVSGGIRTRNPIKELTQSVSLDHAATELGTNSGISPVTSLDRPRGFQEVKVPRLRDSGPG